MSEENRRMTADIQVSALELMNDSHKKIPPSMNTEVVSQNAETTSLNDRRES